MTTDQHRSLFAFVLAAVLAVVLLALAIAGPTPPVKDGGGAPASRDQQEQTVPAPVEPSSGR